MNTKERIMDVALHMFSEKGYEATSIRNICSEVGIKESTLYYHFKNKQDILDSLVTKFKNHIAELLSHIDEIPNKAYLNDVKTPDDPASRIMETYMMDSYLFDPFCNLMIRLMMIEQFHNEELRELYERTMFIDPYKIQMKIMKRLAPPEVLSDSRTEKRARMIHAYMTMLTFRYLLNGELTEERKNAYTNELHTLMNSSMRGEKL